MTRRAFTLIELLVVVAIIAILAAIATVNFLEAQERALKAADASNLHAIGVGLQAYFVDYNTLPLADREAGPFPSHVGYDEAGNGPAGGGSWDGVPWLLVELRYVTNWRTLFCPRYLKIYSGGTTIRGDHPRYHNFRYAYNSSARPSGGHSGGQGNNMSGTTWVVRDLYLPAAAGFYGRYAPSYPADYQYPWGPERDQELCVFADMAVKLVQGGTNQPPDPNASSKK
jgi:prepilin-type N-terminal cleavage/methylation domain-containing protein